MLAMQKRDSTSVLVSIKTQSHKIPFAGSRHRCFNKRINLKYRRHVPGLILKASKIYSNDVEEMDKGADLYEIEKLLTYNDFYLLAVFVLPVIEYMTPICSLMFHIRISYLCKHHHNHPNRPPKNTCLRYLILASKPTGKKD